MFKVCDIFLFYFTVLIENDSVPGVLLLERLNVAVAVAVAVNSV